MASSGKNSIPSPSLPTLTRVIVNKLEVERQKNLVANLSSEIVHEISLELLKPVDGKSQVRIRGEITLDGKWCCEGKKKPVVTFLGRYEARFILPPDTSYEVAEKWMENSFYRDSVIAQAIPVANLHMYSQLEMMGLNPHSKKIGYQSKTDWKELGKLPSTPTRRVRKKVEAVK